jgi:hypothetical protein
MLEGISEKGIYSAKEQRIAGSWQPFHVKKLRGDMTLFLKEKVTREEQEGGRLLGAATGS